jgi:hypothetical protein
MPQLPNIKQNNEQILNDIQSLQQMEQQLFNSLETNPNLTSQQQKEIILKMNQISNMRINLYSTLSGVNNYYGNALSSSIGTLKEQTAAIAIVENELNQAKRRLKALEQEKNNKVRLVEINDYYGDKYAEHASLMKVIIFTLVPIIIFSILNNKGFLPNTLYYILVVIVSIIGSVYFWHTYSSMVRRDNMVYQEYDWRFNPNTAPKGSSDLTDPWATNNLPGTCLGQACCADTEDWDETLNQCVSTSASCNKKESFVNNVLSKTSGNYKNDIDLKDPIPNNSESFINYLAKKY